MPTVIELEPERLGQIVRELRRRRGLSLAATAARGNLTKGGLSRIEREQHTPNVRTLQELAGALDVEFLVGSAGVRVVYGSPDRAGVWPGC